MNVHARSVSLVIYGLAAALLQPVGHSQATFRNPLFKSQDPFVTWWQGNYYYSDSDGDRICIRKSPTLTGLAAQRPQAVWTASRRGPAGHANIWAPEIHILDGKAYLYFAADYNGNGHRRLYVLEGTADPMGAYTPGDTGDPDGQIRESTEGWAIDPDVFFGPDHQLYLTWSCTDDDIGEQPQSLCLARMSDPFHVSSSTVRVAHPTEAWERRTRPIEEGPVGFTRGGVTYVTYSASASWTTNDYAVGLMVNTSGDLLDASAWVKRGPIFDHHGKSYGPGSIVFVPSPDGSELWSMFHTYDGLDCPEWSCRNIQIQKVSWTTDQMPLLGYPVDPGVPGFVPSGDTGMQTGWSDSRLGAPTSGSWVLQSSISLDSTQVPGDQSRQEIFHGDTDLFSYSVSVSIRAEEASSRYGVYGLYRDPANNVEALVDLGRGLFETRAIVGGKHDRLHEFPLSGRFEMWQTHTITIEKTAGQEFIFKLDGTVLDRRRIPLDFGQIGVFTENGGAHFREVTIHDTAVGWGNAFGDAAQGLERSPSPAAGDGFVQGDWHIIDGAAASSLGTGAGWHTLYQGDPNFGSYTVRVDAQWLPSGSASMQQRYGLIVCHDDRDNQVSMWLNPTKHELSLNFVVAGNSTWHNLPLGDGFDASEYHTFGAIKVEREFVFLLDGKEFFRQELELANGTSGIATENTYANFRSYQRWLQPPSSRLQ
jgi:GH43 family beta-xylosidase